MFQTLRDKRLYATFSKFKFYLVSGEIMGHMVFKDDIMVDPVKFINIHNWVKPILVTNIHNFNELTQFYRGI